jgi:hypothetical protein
MPRNERIFVTIPNYLSLGCEELMSSFNALLAFPVAKIVYPRHFLIFAASTNVDLASSPLFSIWDIRKLFEKLLSILTRSLMCSFGREKRNS